MGNQTPGPWQVDEGKFGPLISAPGRHGRMVVANVERGVGYLVDPTPEYTANARLMAAAPELLASLKTLFALAVAPGEFPEARRQRVLTEARAAIRVAEEGQP